MLEKQGSGWVLELQAAETEFGNLNENNCWKDTEETWNEGRPEDRVNNAGAGLSQMVSEPKTFEL